MSSSLPNSGPLSAGIRAGSDKSVNLFKDAALTNTNTNYNTRFSLKESSTALAAVKNDLTINLPQMTVGAPYRFSEFYGANIVTYTQEITWKVAVDGSDYYTWTPGTPYSTLNVTHRNWQYAGSPTISYKTYTNGNVLNSGTLTGSNKGTTSLPFAILRTTDVALTYSGRSGVSITSYPSAQNNYTTTVLINDDGPASNAWYTCTLTYTLKP